MVNLADAAGARTPDLGAYIPLDTRENRFGQFGINVHVLEPGEPNGMYHREDAQEGFMVLHGECLLIVSEEERPIAMADVVGASTRSARPERSSSTPRATASSAPASRCVTVTFAPVARSSNATCAAGAFATDSVNSIGEALSGPSRTTCSMMRL